MLSPRSSHLVAFIGMLLMLCLMAQPSVSTPIVTNLESRGIPFGVQYNKRVAHADFSTGITACGQRYDKSLNGKNTLGVDTKFGKGACGTKVKITAPNGRVRVGTVVDLGAQNGALNLSPALFKQFYNLDQGTFEGNYVFI